ncbi:MAG: hypothetical protein HXO99_01385 [Streptococcus sp.]|nr:hypothetical protein [Streptococcus sp.]
MNKMNRLLSVVSMGLARRWKTILMFLGAWWIITSFLMKIFANGDLSTFGTYFPIYFDNEIGLILLIIGIGYIVEQFRLESQLGLTRKEQIESLFIQTLVDSGVITLIYALLIPLRNGVSLGSVTIQSILGDLFDPENIVISIAVLFVKVVLIHLIANVIGIVLNKINQKTGIFVLSGVFMLSALIGGSAFRRVSDGQMPEFVKALQEFINLITTHKVESISIALVILVVLQILVTRKHQSIAPE